MEEREEVSLSVRTPSPNSRSPEKNVRFILTILAPSIKTEAVSFTPVVPKPTFGVFPNIPLMMNASVDSVQLTQATRPKRRIYVENLPSSASDADVMNGFSGYLLAFLVNKEKGQAVVEFLTPEDASTALSFDGRSFSGNIVKIRRPKDYVEATSLVIKLWLLRHTVVTIHVAGFQTVAIFMQTGVSEKPVAGAVSVRNVVEDSPNKIFIGGISKIITSKMLMEVASAFGSIKGYHFEDSAHPDSPCAFVEYADQAVTVKACAGLNGMKLGGQVMTVTQATPDASSSVENHGEQPSYGTPLQARPLLEIPTQVLKLTNVLDPHSLSTLSEPELEEILEDIRLECARFGMVKSINIIKQTDMPTSSETVKITEEPNSMTNEAKDDRCIETGSQSADSEQHDESTPVGDTNEPEKVNGSLGDDDIVSKKHENNIVKDEMGDTTMVDSVVENENLENSNQISSAIDQSDLNESKLVDDVEIENDSKPEMVPESNDDMKDVTSDLNNLFELGCVLVEYKRTEASSMAAHCLHGRDFDGRTVSVEYVAPDAYSMRLHK
ncbi:splicing factor U2af large subunit B [Tanacetum coccineum]|uniref:Splicing factor U2af large subunit B n=1 Tax=Tanacetum coccineum TaxID=301880 RepID=A0ABQ5CWM5_9ASTR